MFRAGQRVASTLIFPSFMLAISILHLGLLFRCPANQGEMGFHQFSDSFIERGLSGDSRCDAFLSIWDFLLVWGRKAFP